MEITDELRNITWEEALNNRLKDKGWKVVFIFFIPIYGVVVHSFKRKTITPFLYWLGVRLIFALPSGIVDNIAYENDEYLLSSLWAIFVFIVEVFAVKSAIYHDRYVAKELLREKDINYSELKLFALFKKSFSFLLYQFGIKESLEDKSDTKKQYNQSNNQSLKNENQNIEEKLLEAKSLFTKKLISKKDYEQLKKNILEI